MKKQINPTIKAHLTKSTLYLLILSAGTWLAFIHFGQTASVSPRTLTFAQRVAYQRAIEEVYWHHRIWPNENVAPKPALDAVISQTQLENKVEDYLRESKELEDYWKRPINTQQLQAEMDRMARDTKQPEVLRELFDALENDPFLVAECLARPVLTERLIASFAQEQPRNRLALGNAGAKIQTVKLILPYGAYTLPAISDETTGCTPDTWTATDTPHAPPGRFGQTAIWTGSEMIVWGGETRSGRVSTGGRYTPGTDSWVKTSNTNAPTGRTDHTAVWTGSEMIVWGGFDGTNELNSGGRYDPSSDSWTGTSITNAPDAREVHTAVWTGSEMIVWGGVAGSNSFDTGGRYTPGTDSWIATSTTNAPTGRYAHTAVWTGDEMVVWGGVSDITGGVNTGGRYSPANNSWVSTSITNAPDARWLHTAVWTGSEMIVWGGTPDGGPTFFDTGGRYNIGTDSWTATNTANAPEGRINFTAVWTGSEMIVWGGVNSVFLNSGGRYTAGADNWTATSTTDAPIPRFSHTAVWTGGEMIIWGGTNIQQRLNTGGKYCVQSGGTTPTPTPTATGTVSPTPTATVRPSPTPRIAPTPRPRPTPLPRP